MDAPAENKEVGIAPDIAQVADEIFGADPVSDEGEQSDINVDFTPAEPKGDEQDAVYYGEDRQASINRHFLAAPPSILEPPTTAVGDPISGDQTNFEDNGANSFEQEVAYKQWVDMAVDKLNKGEDPNMVLAELAHDGCPDPEGALQRAMKQPEQNPEDMQPEPLTTSPDQMGGAINPNEMSTMASRKTAWEDEGEDDELSPDDWVITSRPNGGYSVGDQEGHHLGQFDDIDRAHDAIRQRMRKDQFFPNVWLQDDHGGLMIDADFRHDLASRGSEDLTNMQNPMSPDDGASMATYARLERMNERAAQFKSAWFDPETPEPEPDHAQEIADKVDEPAEKIQAFLDQFPSEPEAPADDRLSHLRTASIMAHDAIRRDPTSIESRKIASKVDSEIRSVVAERRAPLAWEMIETALPKAASRPDAIFDPERAGDLSPSALREDAKIRVASAANAQLATHEALEAFVNQASFDIATRIQGMPHEAAEPIHDAYVQTVAHEAGIRAQAIQAAEHAAQAKTASIQEAIDISDTSSLFL